MGYDMGTAKRNGESGILAVTQATLALGGS